MSFNVVFKFIGKPTVFIILSKYSNKLQFLCKIANIFIPHSFLYLNLFKNLVN